MWTYAAAVIRGSGGAQGALRGSGGSDDSYTAFFLLSMVGWSELPGRIDGLWTIKFAC